MEIPAYSLVIPTYQRPDALLESLLAVKAQTCAPAAVIVVDSSKDDRTRDQLAGKTDVIYEKAKVASAAQQRNQGAEQVRTPIVGFMDDDITLRPETCERILRVFAEDAEGRIGGIAVRLEDLHRPAPSRLTRWYLRWQAGFEHATYGGRLFGPAINCLPCYTESEEDLIPADWLNSGCVFYRTALFERERFPQFEGYSFMEDVHLSARIAKTHRLYFHRTATCLHRDGAVAGRARGEMLRIARMRLRNQRLVAHDVMGLTGPKLELKLLAHRLFFHDQHRAAAGPGLAGGIQRHMELIIRIWQGFLSRFRRAWLSARGVEIRGHVWLRTVSVPRNPKGITLESGAALDDGVVLLATDPGSKIVIGAGCYINRNTIIDASERLEIGALTMIGPFCYLTDHDHAITPGASPGAGPLLSRPTMIGEKCWIGAHVSILKGVTIGAGTVVGAGSVVTKSLPPGVIAVGNPARVLREITAP